MYGGRNHQRRFNQTFNDVFLLDLIHLSWFEVRIFDGIAKERYEHCAVVSGNNLIIFGGMDDQMYIAADLFIITIGMSFYLL